MSKKFFSLIHGEKIHLAPGTKVIPKESLSTLLDSREVLKNVGEDAEKYKIEVAAGCEKLKEEAKRIGFEEGYAEWIEQIAALEEEIKKVRKDAERVIVPLAVKAAKKILGRELELSETTIVDIVANSLKTVASHKKIKIYVNKKEFEIMEKHKERLKKAFENLEAFSILTQDEITPGGCIIETEGGIINAQLENQWLILENAFKKLLKSTMITSEAITEPSAVAALKKEDASMSDARNGVKSKKTEIDENEEE